MKKASLSALALVLLLALSACGATTASSNSFRTSSNTRSLTPEEKLALGSIKLEGTTQAVDAKTAGKLVPLWQLMLQLNTSSSTAPEEVTAVTDQIKATMTQAQLNTIEGMTLTQADIFTAFQSQGQADGSGRAGGAAGSGAFGRNSGGGGGGGFVFAGGGPGGAPGGGFGGGAGFRGNTGTASGTTTQADPAQAAQAAQARENAVSASLINQLIKLLQTKLGS